MRQRLPDIKTVDTFFEVFSDREKFMKRMDDMRAIRDEIRAELGKVDTKEKADKLLAQAQSANATATTLMEQAVAERTSGLEEVKKAKDAQKKDSAGASKSNNAFKKNLEEREVLLDKREAEFETGMVSRETAIAEREDKVSAREENVLTREGAVKSWADSMKEAASHGSL